MSEEELPEGVPEGAAEAREPHEPRIRVLKGKPWVIDDARRAKWSAEEFVRHNAVQIRQIGDPVLHAAAKRSSLPKAELEALVARMFASMVAAHGIGIAAPQIGIALRIAIVDVDEAGIVALDPQIEAVTEEAEETSEGCLSVRGFYGMLERPVGARVRAVDVNGRKFVVEGDDLGAQCLLHEADHLNGKLYVDRLRSREDLHSVDKDETEEASA
jgi:peptide deformylase